MTSQRRSLALVLLVLAASACNGDKTDEERKSETPRAPTSTPPAAAKGGVDSTSSSTPARSLPNVPALTEDVAKKALHAPLAQLGGDDLSRKTLLYLADLGDKAGADAARKALETKDGKYDDRPSAAVALEALLVYGEKDAAAKALDLAKQYAAAEDAPDEYLVHALARVKTEPERAAAVAALTKIASGEGGEGTDISDVAAVAAEELAAVAAPEARETFAKIAADAKLGGEIRGAAVAGLLRLSDPRGKTLAEKLVAEATAPAPEQGAKPPAPAKPETEGEGPPQPEDVIKGLGVEGASDAAQYVRKILDIVLSDESNAAMLEAPEAASALARIFATGGGGQDIAQWLRDLAKKDEFHESEASLALWALGDDSAASSVAQQLTGAVEAWASPTNMDGAIEILDIAARRGVARSALFRAVVDAAAQVDASGTKRPGTDVSLRELNVAAAHAFLKSGAK